TNQDNKRSTWDRTGGIIHGTSIGRSTRKNLSAEIHGKWRDNRRVSIKLLSQAAAKPSHKTTSSNHTVYRFTSPRISRSSCSKDVRKVTHGLNGFGKECASRRVPNGKTKGGKGKERWDARRDRYLRGRTVTHKMAIRR
ncbi:unnamed protein product, partial [Heterotrigona itama]